MRHCRHKVEGELVDVVVVVGVYEADVVVVDIGEVDVVVVDVDVIDVDEVAVLKVTSPPDSRKRDEMQEIETVEL